MRVAALLLCLVAAPAPAAELFAGLLAHGVNLRGTPPPPALLFEGTEENGTQDLDLGIRSGALGSTRFVETRAAGKAQLNLGGRTSFLAAGFEFRRPFAGGRLYAQAGIGVALHSGYSFLPDPFERGLSADEAARRDRLYRTRIAFGSRVLFNPNLSLGVRLSPRLAAEAVWEHYSHAQVFSGQNPGIDSIGLRLVFRPRAQ